MKVLNVKEYYKINKDNIKFIKAKKGINYYLYANINSYFVFNINSNNVIDNFIFNIGDYYFNGNTFDEFDDLIEYISLDICSYDDVEHMKKYIPVYVDDLTYYYYFFKKKFNLEDVFSVKGNVAYLRYLNIEFRCLGVLSDLEFNTECTIDYVNKQKDYLSKFTSIDKKYNYTNLPLTQIKFVKDSLLSYKNGSRSNYDLLKIQSLEEYQLLSQCWSGGICSYNRKCLGKNLGRVKLFDFKSAYPSVMCKYNLYPTRFLEFKILLNNVDYINTIKTNCVIGHVLLKDLKHKKGFPYIKQDLIYKFVECYEGNINVVTNLDTNEVISASYIKLYLTDIDYLVLKKFYDFELVGCTDCYIYERGSLPKSLISCVLKYFDIKETKEKDTVEYIISKKALNSIFGLNYIDPVRNYKSIDDVNNVFENKLTKGINELLLEYNLRQESGKNYTSYQWGLYICAIQRLVLSGFIEKAVELGIWVYSDTDSLYVRVNENTKEFNRFVKEWNKKHYIFINNILKRDKCRLGLLECEGYYDRFKVLAKKQYITSKNDKIEVTMSGVNKSKASNILNDLNKEQDIFKLVKRGFVFKNIRKNYVETEYGVKIDYSDITLGE